MSSASIEPARAIRATVAGVIPFTLGAVGGLLLTGRPDRPPLVPREYAYFQYLMLGLVTLIASFIFHAALTRSWRPSLWQAENQAPPLRTAMHLVRQQNFASPSLPQQVCESTLPCSPSKQAR